MPKHVDELNPKALLLWGRYFLEASKEARDDLLLFYLDQTSLDEDGKQTAAVQLLEFLPVFRDTFNYRCRKYFASFLGKTDQTEVTVALPPDLEDKQCWNDDYLDGLDTIDRRIAEGVIHGDTVSNMAEELGLSVYEVRRRKETVVKQMIKEMEQ